MDVALLRHIALQVNFYLLIKPYFLCYEPINRLAYLELIIYKLPYLFINSKRLGISMSWQQKNQRRLL